MGKTLRGGGYISRELFERLYRRGIKLIRRLKKNMKNKMMGMEEKVLIRKRAVIGSANDFLKTIWRTGHRRYRRFTGFRVNLFGALSAYSFLPHKPSVRRVCDNRLLPVPL
jgi:hypothetical protein